VDFVAFVHAQGQIIEIDGPSHYATYDEGTHEYTLDEDAYARNLKVARYLEAEGWQLTRIGRSEVREAMKALDTDDFTFGFACIELMRLLPFYRKDYPAVPSFLDLGLPEIQRAAESNPDTSTFFAPTGADDDIPF
jgi:hypothetical protein